jgi:hypothetical protein
MSSFHLWGVRWRKSQFHTGPMTPGLSSEESLIGSSRIMVPRPFFRDIGNIPLGIDYRKYINDVLGGTDILLAIIGPDWAGKTPDGRTASPCSRRQCDDS